MYCVCFFVFGMSGLRVYACVCVCDNGGLAVYCLAYALVGWCVGETLGCGGSFWTFGLCGGARQSATMNENHSVVHVQCKEILK